MKLVPGRVYRTRDLRQWSANPTRLAKRLIREGKLESLARGLFVHPRLSRFGAVPPTDDEILDGFLEGTPFVITGPERWNALGLGSTAMFAAPLVYNTKRSGEFALGGRRFHLRRVAFPTRPDAEWFVVDLLEHHAAAGVSRKSIEENLARAIEARRFDREKLAGRAREFGTRATRTLVERAMRGRASA